LPEFAPSAQVITPTALFFKVVVQSRNSLATQRSAAGNECAFVHFIAARQQRTNVLLSTLLPPNLLVQYGDAGPRFHSCVCGLPSKALGQVGAGDHALPLFNAQLQL
jgi:hypothetical protein